MLYFNFSGHPANLPENSEPMAAPFVGINLEMSDPGRVVETIREVLLSLPDRGRLLAGAKATIILPGMSPAAGIFLAEWHGQFGNFPAIRWSIRTDAGFVFTQDTVADLAEVRDSARTAR